MALITLYGPPGLDARQSVEHSSIASYSAEDDELAGAASRCDRAMPNPDFTVSRDQSLYLIAPRSTIVEEIRNLMNTRIVVLNGVRHIDVRRGSANFVKGAYGFLGKLAGAAQTAATPFRVAGMIINNTSGALNTVANLGQLLVHNPFSHAGRTMLGAQNDAAANVEHALVEVSCAAANHHALAAAAAPAAARPGAMIGLNRTSQSAITMRELANNVAEILARR